MLSVLRGEGTGPDFLVAGLTGASLFAITLLAIPYARRLRESEALVQQREIDIADLNELNEFIVQHLRESILVVDELDRIRLINETAARLLRGGPIVRRHRARRGRASAAVPAAGVATAADGATGRDW